MSRWNDDWRSFRNAEKKPPPEHGIKMKKAGTTWWGQRWIAALEHVLRGDAGRLERGRAYARAGRVHDLVVVKSEVVAKVTGSGPKPYEVSIALKRLGDQQWAAAIAAMAGKAQFSAELLAGQMPQEIDAAFQTARASLFPQKRAELDTFCSCPDSGDPCKHIAATHYVLGEALDRDPFLLFELRGRSKEQVLAALRAARSAEPSQAQSGTRGKQRRKRAAKVEPIADASASTSPHIREDAQEIPAVALGKLAAADYDKPRAELPALHFSFDPPAASGALLRQLGAPAAYDNDTTPAEALAPLVRAASEAARRIALAEPVAPVEPPSVPSMAPASRRRSRK